MNAREGRPVAWWPGVEALRGVAVAAVLVYHHSPDRLPGGFLGVSLFFTLSGFLITTLLLREHDRDGTIRLRRFWARRLRRLAPVALLGLGLAAAVSAITHPAGRLAEIGGDITAAALHVSNWRFAASGVDYGDTFNLPSPVVHYWSLSIEEQFYAVYPLLTLVALKWGRRAFVAVLGIVVAASLVRQFGLDANRAYLGTDTRCLELAVGAVVAVGRLRFRKIAGHLALDVAAVTSLALLCAVWLTVDLSDERLFRGGLALHALLSAVVVVGAADGRLVAALGQLRPLVALGAISYGVYVVHWPLFLLLEPARVGLDGPLLLGVRVAATCVVAFVIHLLVEQPVRLGLALPNWRAPLALATAMSIIVLAAVALPRLELGGPEEVLAGGATLVTMPDPGPTTASTAVPATTAGPTTMPAPVPTTSAAPATDPVLEPTEAPSPTTTPSTAGPSPVPPAPPAPPDHLLVVGDSSAQFIGLGMQEWAADRGVRVDLLYEYACTLLDAGQFLIREGWIYEQTQACRNLVGSAVDIARELDVDAIVLFIGNFQLASWRPSDAVAFSGVGDGVVDPLVLGSISEAIDTLAVAGVPVLVADLPLPDWDVDVPTPSGTLPGSGPPTINDPERVAALNRLTQLAVEGNPRTRLVPWASILAGPDGVIDPADRHDGLHVRPEVARSLMAGALGDAIATLYADASLGL
ncbi:MAG: acyltransferase family protein [Acidimicrobiia bacterium]|nr:acyltransferase family protein [Acidimicrobiia bacterium]